MPTKKGSLQLPFFRDNVSTTGTKTNTHFQEIGSKSLIFFLPFLI